MCACLMYLVMVNVILYTVIMYNMLQGVTETLTCMFKNKQGKDVYYKI